MKKLLSFAIALSACSLSGMSDRQPVRQPEDRISGVWEFRLLHTRDGSTVDVVGTVALLPRLNTGSPVLWFNLPDPTHFGVYTADLRPVNVTRELEERIPHAGARVSNTDSVLVVLNPAPNHGSVVLRGVVKADSIVGTWLVTSYGAGTPGTFVMWRRHTDTGR
jgi:hypothetical protein